MTTTYFGDREAHGSAYLQCRKVPVLNQPSCIQNKQNTTIIFSN